MAGYTLPKINEHSDKLTVIDEDLSKNSGREYGGLDRKDAERMMVQHAWGDERYPDINKTISRKDDYDSNKPQNKSSNLDKQRFALPSLNSESSNHDDENSDHQISKRNGSIIRGDNLIDTNHVSKKGNKPIKTGKKKRKVSEDASTKPTENEEQEETPRDILARLTQRRQSAKQEQKNPAVWKKTGQPDTVRQPLGKHMMASAEGKSGAKQMIDNSLEEVGDQINDKNLREFKQGEKTGSMKQRRQKKQPEINELGSMLSLGVNAQKTRMAAFHQPTFGTETTDDDSSWQNGFIPNVAPPVNNEIGRKIKIKQAVEEEKISMNSTNELDGSKNSLSMLNEGKRTTIKQNSENAPKLKGYTGQSRKDNVKHEEEQISLPNVATHRHCISEDEESLGRNSSRLSPVLQFHVKPSSSSSSSKTPTNQNNDNDKKIIQNTKQRRLSLTNNADSYHNVSKKVTHLPIHYSHVKVDRRSVFQMADAELAIKRRVTQSEVMALSMFRFQSSFTFSFFSLPDQYKKHNDSIIENTKYIGRRGGNKPRKIQRPNKTLVDTK